MRMILRIAIRNVFRNRRRSLYTVAAVAFGLLCLIVFQALKVGLHEQMVRSTVLLDTGTVQVHAKGYKSNLATLKPLPSSEEVEKAIIDCGGLAYAKRIKTPALILAKAKSSTVLLSGVDTEHEPDVTFIKDKLLEGDYLTKGGVLISRNLAEPLGVGLGDNISLMAQGATGKPITRKFPVTGIFKTALERFDRTHIYMTGDEARDFLRAEGMVTEVVAVSLQRNADMLAEKLSGVLDPDRYQVKTWKEIAPDVHQLIMLNDSTMALLIAIVYAIVAMGIVNTMSMAVYERFHEIGIQMAVGDSPRKIFKMIVLESAVLGLFASVVGSILGVAACAYLAEYGVDLTALTSANHYFAESHVLKASLTFSDLLLANMLTIATASLAGIFPAFKATRMEVVEALSHA